MEQKLPAAQEKLTEEQAVSLKLMGTTWSRSSRAAMEKITVQQWMWSGGAPTGAGPRAAAHAEEPQRIESDHEGAVKTKHHGLTVTSVPCSPALHMGRDRSGQMGRKQFLVCLQFLTALVCKQ